MSRFRFNRRCWNPSSSTITWTPLSFTNRPAPRILSSSTATTAGGTLMLICAGSSPTSAVSCPDTRTYPDVVRPYPRLRMPTFLPSAISHCAISSTSRVFPLPPRRNIADTDDRNSRCCRRQHTAVVRHIAQPDHTSIQPSERNKEKASHGRVRLLREYARRRCARLPKCREVHEPCEGPRALSEDAVRLPRSPLQPVP